MQVISKDMRRVYDLDKWDANFYADGSVRIYAPNHREHPEANFVKGEYILRHRLQGTVSNFCIIKT